MPEPQESLVKAHLGVQALKECLTADTKNLVNNIYRVFISYRNDEKFIPAVLQAAQNDNDLKEALFAVAKKRESSP